MLTQHNNWGLSKSKYSHFNRQEGISTAFKTTHHRLFAVCQKFYQQLLVITARLYSSVFTACIGCTQKEIPAQRLMLTPPPLQVLSKINFFRNFIFCFKFTRRKIFQTVSLFLKTSKFLVNFTFLTQIYTQKIFNFPT